MRVSKAFFKTYRENPSDAEITSHKLLVRGGYINKQSMGIYSYMPLGVKVMEKIENIIREEMNMAGAVEVHMPILLPLDVYSSRINHFGSLMFKLKDSQNKDYCLGPTHEEVFTNLVKDYVNSYKQLPITLYQIQTKFRDEIRPRFGLQRSKEFLMKDAYSYDVNTQGLDNSFDNMNTAYNRIFQRLGLDYVSVDADNGSMGGTCSREFMVKSNIGEDSLVVCDKCGYGANTEKCECITKYDIVDYKNYQMEKVKTPCTKTIEDLTKFFGLKKENFVKSVVYKVDNKVVVALVRGDKEVQEVKLLNSVKGINIEMATAEDIKKIGSVAGFVGAVNLQKCTVVADNEIKNMDNFIIGANDVDFHYKNTNIKDLQIDLFADIRLAVSGDVCPNCKVGHLSQMKGIEVGHIFKLGTRYTENLGCKFLDENGKEQVMQMGCYGIGVSRTLSAIVEQNNDERGIVWPKVVAPYQVYMVTANHKDETQINLANKIYDNLQSKGVEILYDDRKESLGVKMTDGELIGIPTILIVGRDAINNKVELVVRSSLKRYIVSVDDIIRHI